MGGFATIPLSYRNPQFQNPADMQQQGLQLQNLAQQGQTNQLQQTLMQQQIQEGQIHLETQQQIAQAVQGAMGDNMAKISGTPQTPTDPNAPPPAVSQTSHANDPEWQPTPAAQSAFAGQSGAPSLTDGLGTPPPAAVPPQGMPALNAPPQGAASGSPAMPASQPSVPDAAPSVGTGRQSFGAFNDAILARLQAHPLAYQQMYGQMLAMAEKNATLTTAQLKNQDTMADNAAGKWLSFAQQTSAYKQANWPAFKIAEYQAGHLSKQESQALPNDYTQLGDPAHGGPDQAVINMGHAFLSASQLSKVASEMGTAQRGQAMLNESVAKQQQLENVTAAATYPTDPASRPAWRATLPDRLQKVFGETPAPNESAIVTKLATPAADWQKMADTDVSSISSALADRGRSDPSGQTRATFYNNLKATNPDLAARFTAPQNFNPKTTPQADDQVGLNSGQRSTAASQAVMQADARQRLGIEGARLSLERQKLNDALGTGPLSKGQGENKIYEYTTLEAKNNTLRNQLGQAIQGGQLFVDKTGAAKPFSSLNVGDDERQQMIQDMKSRYQGLTEEAIGIVGDKNRVYLRMGTTPSVSTEDAQNAIVSGARDVLGKNYRPAQGTPAVPTGTTQPRGSGTAGFTPPAAKPTAAPPKPAAAPPAAVPPAAKPPAAPSGPPVDETHISYQKNKADGSYTITTKDGMFKAKNLDQMNQYLKAMYFEPITE